MAPKPRPRYVLDVRGDSDRAVRGYGTMDSRYVWCLPFLGLISFVAVCVGVSGFSVALVVLSLCFRALRLVFSSFGIPCHLPVVVCSFCFT